MKRLAAIFVVLVIAAVGDTVFLGPQNHGEFWWSQIPSFFALFGLSGCIAIMFLAKYVLARWLQRNGDYYEKGPGA
jgi:hypothetical protein